MTRSMKRVLGVLSLVLILAIAVSSLGVAYAGGIRGIGLLGVWFFLTFGILIVLAQVIPAGILLASLIGSAFTRHRRAEVPVLAT